MINSKTTFHDERSLRARESRRVEIALALLQKTLSALKEGLPADATLGRIFRENRQFGSRDRRDYANTIFSYLRWRGWLKKLPEKEIRKASAIAALLDATKVTPFIEELTRQTGIITGLIKPMGAISLEQKASCVAELLNLPCPPHPQDLIPSWVYSEVNLHSHPESYQNRLVEEMQQRPPIWLRVSTGTDRKLLPASWQPDARLTNAWRTDTTVDVYRFAKETGVYVEIQDLASQCVGSLCGALPGQSWWDVCAGSGGKALHLADMMERNGQVLATDVRSGIIRELRRRVRRQHLDCIHVKRISSDQPKPFAHRSFDGVLVDAPCSGMGTWGRNPDARWRMGKRAMEGLVHSQAHLLNMAADAVKEGGTLIYAVCTLTRRETLDLVKSFMQRRQEFVPAKVQHPLTGEEEKGCVWIWPWQGPCNGMFVCRMTRHG